MRQAGAKHVLLRLCYGWWITAPHIFPVISLSLWQAFLEVRPTLPRLVSPIPGYAADWRLSFVAVSDQWVFSAVPSRYVDANLRCCLCVHCLCSLDLHALSRFRQHRNGKFYRLPACKWLPVDKTLRAMYALTDEALQWQLGWHLLPLPHLTSGRIWRCGCTIPIVAPVYWELTMPNVASRSVCRQNVLSVGTFQPVTDADRMNSNWLFHYICLYWWYESSRFPEYRK